MIVSREEIINTVAETLIRASSSFRKDQVEAYKRAIGNEKPESSGRWVIEQILKNAEFGEKNKRPLCDDTGIPHIYLEIGEEVEISGSFFATVEEGIRLGLRNLPGRPMAVRGDDLKRITQEEGMFTDPAELSCAPFQIRHIPGKKVRLTVLMLGGGPEIRGKTLRVFHKHNLETVREEMIRWGLEGSGLLGCQPCVLFFGIGRSNVEAASLSLEAMAKADFSVASEFEKSITDAINDQGVGALGLGGNTTVLSTFVKIGPQRASGVRIISLRVGCCFDPRKATCEWE